MTQRKTSLRARQLVYYAIAVLLVLSGNSVYSIMGANSFFMGSAIFVLLAIVTIALWMKRPVQPRFLGRWALWVALVSLAFIAVVLTNGVIAPDSTACYAALFAFAPLAVHVISRSQELQSLLDAFVNVVVVLGALSVTLWLLGDVIRVVSPNCSVSYHWVVRGAAIEYKGFFYLLFQTQRVDGLGLPEGIAAVLAWRNTGIYPEGPMYSYTLCCALLCEVFLRKRPRKWACAVLGITLVTTFTTTGYLVALAAVVLVALKRGLTGRYKSVVIALSCVALAAVAVLVVVKLQSASGSTRIDDFRACFLTWLQDPLFGCGFGNTLAIKANMSAWRVSNMGLSNSLGYVLATGGIAFFIPHAMAFAGFFIRGSGFKAKALGACFLFMWSITIVATLPVSAIMLALGVERLCAYRVSCPSEFPDS